MEEINLPDSFSLLWPEGADPSPDSDRPRWGERTQADLGIETLAGHLSPDPQYTKSILSFLLPLTTDTGIIGYRQEVLEDFLSIPEVAAVFESLQEPLLEIERLGGPPPGGADPAPKNALPHGGAGAVCGLHRKVVGGAFRQPRRVEIRRTA